MSVSVIVAVTGPVVSAAMAFAVSTETLVAAGAGVIVTASSPRPVIVPAEPAAYSATSSAWVPVTDNTADAFTGTVVLTSSAVSADAAAVGSVTVIV